MIVKESVKFDLPPGASGSYGEDYMVRISKKSAQRLMDETFINIGLFRIPKPGYGVVLKTTRSSLGFINQLTLQNLYGNYYLASATNDKIYWPREFGVTVHYLP
jgi:hypothetical protein